jgi:hypothetical protein
MGLAWELKCTCEYGYRNRNETYENDPAVGYGNIVEASSPSFISNSKSLKNTTDSM